MIKVTLKMWVLWDVSLKYIYSYHLERKEVEIELESLKIIHPSLSKKLKIIELKEVGLRDGK